MSRFFYKYYYLGVPQYRLSAGPSESGFMAGERTADPPVPLDGPALELTDTDIGKGIMVFDRSLTWLKGRFPRVPITIAYVPSALSIYPLTGARYRYSIEPSEEDRSDWATPAQIARNSDLLCNLVRDTSARLEVGFLDTRPPLREAASKELLHGPMDWVHFNAQGYRALGHAIAGNAELAAVDRCDKL
jgi:hypothetical protein